MRILDSKHKRNHKLQKNNIIKKKLFNKESFFYIKYIFLLIFMFQISLCTQSFGVSNSYEITIKIQGKGNQQILSSNFTQCPDSVYIGTTQISTLVDNCRFINIPDGYNFDTSKEVIALQSLNILFISLALGV